MQGEQSWRRSKLCKFLRRPSCAHASKSVDRQVWGRHAGAAINWIAWKLDSMHFRCVTHRIALLAYSIRVPTIPFHLPLQSSLDIRFFRCGTDERVLVMLLDEKQKFLFFYRQTSILS